MFCLWQSQGALQWWVYVVATCLCIGHRISITLILTQLPVMNSEVWDLLLEPRLDTLREREREERGRREGERRERGRGSELLSGHPLCARFSLASISHARN